MPEINDILTALNGAYSGGADRVNWVSELKPILDNLTNELLARGVKNVANTAALSTQKGTDIKFIIVTGIGLFAYQNTGTANGTTIFNASGGGVYTLIFSGGGGGAAAKEIVTVSGESTKTITWDGVRLAAYGQWPNFSVWMEHEGGIWRQSLAQFQANDPVTPTSFSVDFAGPVNAKIIIS